MDRLHLAMLAAVRKQDAMTAEVLADRFSVSTRTVRSRIKSINNELAPFAHIAHRRGVGYSFVMDDEAAFATWERQQAAPLSRGVAPQTAEERVQYLLHDLLNRNGWITIEEYADALYVAPRTLSHDMKDVEERLASFHLTLERRPRYGMRVTGTEIDRRLCLAHLVMEHDADAAGGFESLDAEGLLPQVASCVDAVTQEDHFSINAMAYQNLIVHIVIAIARIRSGCYVPLEQAHLDHIRQQDEYRVAARIAARIADELGIELPDEEIAYMAIHLSGKRMLQFSEGESDGLVISDEVWDVVSAMLEVVWKMYHFDFRNDLELRMNLARHIVPLSVRLRYHLHMDNPLLADIRSRYALAYAMAVDASAVLSCTYEATLSDDEIGYIALAFALALERQKEGLPKKNILVVCASGAGSAKLLEFRYRREFGAYLDSITTCDVGHLDQIDFGTIDYVFTTVPLHRELPVPVREVSYFLDDADRAQVRSLLNESSAPAAKDEGRFPAQLFFPHVDADSREQVIHLLCDAVCHAGIAPAELEASVLERERLAPTAFGNRVAMPHPLEPMGERTAVAVALLDTPISWNKQEVQAVFLVVIARDRAHDLTDFYNRFTRLLWSADAIHDLLVTQRREALLELLDRYGNANG